MERMTVGDIVEPRVIETVQSSQVRIPHPAMLMHLQFRRFAGCPICTVHIHAFAQRIDEIATRGIQEIAVFHSPRAALREHADGMPFALIADPAKRLYEAFGVEASPRSVLHPRSWAAMRGVLRYGVSLPGPGETPLGLPADFLIGQDGRILACKYGRHADDQWTVDELLELAGPPAPNTTSATS
jgi:peroxiredoxin